MIDFHCHILPGVDDGAASLEESLAMARCFVGDGITHVFATPHCHRYVHWLRDDVLPHVAVLQGELDSAGIQLKVLPGSEIQVTDTAEYRREFDSGLYCHLGGKRAMTLLEFNWARALFPSDAVELTRWIRSKGTIVLLAHPERHDYFWREPALLDTLVAAGAWVQITVDSLLGNHGPGPLEWSEKMLRKYPLALLATDAHNMNRCSGLRAGYDWVSANLGSERRDDLLQRARDALLSCTA